MKLGIRWHAAAAALATSLAAAAPAEATTMFDVDSAASTITLTSASFRNTAGTFDTILEFLPVAEYTRNLSGIVQADTAANALETANLLIEGDPVTGDQLMVDRRGNPRDVGDYSFSGVGFSVDEMTIATLTSGLLDFDLSLGSFRVSSPEPIDLAGVVSPMFDLGFPAIITGPEGSRQLTQLFVISFEDVTVISGGIANFSFSGMIVANEIPEPSVSLLVVASLMGVGYAQHRRCHR